MLEKIQKVLAQSGLGSRRKIEEYIKQKRIKVNGVVAHIGQRIAREVKVTFDDKPLSIVSDKITPEVLLYHKPVGEVCSRDDEQGRDTVFDNLPAPRQGRWINVGRLDINTSGVLLFTNDGVLAHKLMHPSQQIDREYAVRVFGEVDAEMLSRLTKGVQLEDGMARFEEIVQRDDSDGRNHWFYVLVQAGRNRLVRRLWESQSDVQVSRLIRVRFANIALPKKLAAGESCEVKPDAVQALFKLAGIMPKLESRGV